MDVDQLCQILRRGSLRDNGNGTFDIYGYPEACFPPTDFHSATLVGKHIYIIGNCGYPKDRRPGETPVYRLTSTHSKLRKWKQPATGRGGSTGTKQN